MTSEEVIFGKRPIQSEQEGVLKEIGRETERVRRKEKGRERKEEATGA